MDLKGLDFDYADANDIREFFKGKQKAFPNMKRKGVNYKKEQSLFYPIDHQKKLYLQHKKNHYSQSLRKGNYRQMQKIL